jgi:AraC-like DNA-binding protein
VPYRISAHAATRPYALRRSWGHISAHKENIAVMRYVKSGTFQLTQGGRTIEVGAGHFSFSKSAVPHRWEVVSEGPTEYYSMLLPLDVLHRCFPKGVPMKVGLCPADGRRLAMPTLFSLLADHGQHLEASVAGMLIDALMQEAREVASEYGAEVDARKRICDKRLDDVLAYISLHLGNPDITAAAVAQACGISPRYLFYLLKLKGATFSDLLWQERLKKAREWLLALDGRYYTIGEIAYMNGFKTAAHFSRLFKTFWGCSPREYRKSGGKCVSAPQAPDAGAQAPHAPPIHHIPEGRAAMTCTSINEGYANAGSYL